MSDLETLKSHRRDLNNRLAAVSQARERLRQAEGDEARVLAAIADLGRDEVEALRHWARTGEGDKPQPNVEARRELNDALVAAQEAAETAKRVTIDLDAEQTSIAAELAKLDLEIENAAILKLDARREAELQTLERYIAEHVRPRLARAMAFHAFLVGRARDHQAAGRSDAARGLFQRAEALASAWKVDPSPSQGDVVAKVSVWTTRMAELTDDAPSSADNVVKIGTAA